MATEEDNSDAVCIKSPRIGRFRRLLFVLFIFLIIWVLFDLCVYICLTRIRRKFHIFRMPVPAGSKQIEHFADNYFHPKWGWDIAEEDKGRFGNRQSREYKDKQRYKIKVFGDSFAYGGNVTSDETWEHFLEERTGWECLNFGVPAYGVDQSLLKYKDNNIKTEYVILTIVDENIGRVVTSCWGFCSPRGIQTKPRFSISGDGSFFLVDNPLKSVDDLKQMQDIGFFDQLAEDDYWNSYYSKLNMPRRPTWPATFLILSHRDFFIKYFEIYRTWCRASSLESMLARRKFYHLYEEGSEGLALMRYIIDEFINTAWSRGEAPIIVLFPIPDSIVIMRRFHTKPYKPLVEHLDRSGYKFIDFGDVFSKEQYKDYYRGHFSIKGNRRVAQVVGEYIEKLEQEPDSQKPVLSRSAIRPGVDSP